MATPFKIAAGLFLAVALGVTGEPARAAWVAVKNDTKQVIVIQEIGGPLNRPIRGKCIKLQPGETHREFHLLAGSKSVVIYDSEMLNTPLAQDKMIWLKDDATFAIKSDGATVKMVPNDGRGGPVEIKK